MDQPPFAAKDELCGKLYIVPNQHSIRRRPTPASSMSQVQKTATEKSYLPGQPRITLQDPAIGSYLESELVTRDLDRLAPHLWLVAKQDSSHISSLTHQIVRGREIIITEEPGLHLVWIYDRVYIKPIPKYLLSHAFWEFYLTGRDSPIPEPLRQDIARAAFGFLRSYLYLIRHKSDFILATDEKLRLIPKEISYTEFVKFVVSFEKVEDISVSPRWRFGELRLTRLNFWSKIFLRRFAYHKVHGQYGDYFARFYGPILFVFGIFSVSLSAMQVALAVQPFVQLGQSWITFAKVSSGFSILTLVCVVLIALSFLSMLVALSFRETIFAVKDLFRKNTLKPQNDVEGSVSSSKSA